ncbi:MAG: nucleotidyltransferase family protein [Chloroflexi bacterium]|nr:nucleotidyltransferase family protein [Chloroflexota bacterium]
MSDARGVGAVILAAGMSRRFGSPKQLVVIGGKTLVEHALDAAMAADLAPVVAVVPVWLSPLADPAYRQLRWILNPFPERGMSLSLRLGFCELGDEVDAAMILLGDQPALDPETISAILRARLERPLVAAVAERIAAPPILIERSHFHLIDDLAGDVGLRQLIRSNPDLVYRVPVAGHPLDLDTPEDLGRMLDP